MRTRIKPFIPSELYEHLHSEIDEDSLIEWAVIDPEWVSKFLNAPIAVLDDSEAFRYSYQFPLLDEFHKFVEDNDLYLYDPECSHSIVMWCLSKGIYGRKVIKFVNCDIYLEHHSCHLHEYRDWQDICLKALENAR